MLKHKAVVERLMKGGYWSNDSFEIACNQIRTIVNLINVSGSQSTLSLFI